MLETVIRANGKSIDLSRYKRRCNSTGTKRALFLCVGSMGTGSFNLRSNVTYSLNIALHKVLKASSRFCEVCSTGNIGFPS